MTTALLLALIVSTAIGQEEMNKAVGGYCYWYKAYTCALLVVAGVAIIR